jgi:hypothetical protein
MIHIKDHNQKDLFDPWAFLRPKRRELLDQSWAGLFQKELLRELPVGKVIPLFTHGFGRPKKELYTALGALLLQLAHDLTDEETVNQKTASLPWYSLAGIDCPVRWRQMKPISAEKSREKGDAVQRVSR